MTNTYFISDLHLGHKKILDFSPDRGGNTPEEHDEWIIDSINSVVNKRDNLYILGDLAFTAEGLAKCSQIRGNKNLILGNHDQFPVERYSEYFKVRQGIMKYRGFWLSHAPIHPDELRGCKNIHGHVHSNPILKTVRRDILQEGVRVESYTKILDKNYINVCVEPLKGIPISLEEILDVT